MVISLFKSDQSVENSEENAKLKSLERYLQFTSDRAAIHVRKYMQIKHK